MSCGLDHATRRARLAEAFGRPRRFVAADALRLLGLREAVHPRDALAYAYHDRRAADAWAASNWEHYRHPLLGCLVVEGAGVVGAYDLRPMLAAHGCELTDPGLPDDWCPA